MPDLEAAKCLSKYIVFSPKYIYLNMGLLMATLTIFVVIVKNVSPS